MIHNASKRAARPSGFAAALLSILSTTAALLMMAMPTAAPLRAQDPMNAPALVRGGASELMLQLRRLDGVKRVLMIGAHPDDEDTALLTALSRGMGAETAYLSLTRGDGGQNLIGPELFEGLGVVRTGELLAARRLDGGAQYFTRAFDYGFSKSADEALSLWPREELLRDVTWVVRSFRPHVIVSVFSGTPQDGHGQHQAAGIMAEQVFDAAADPEQFADQLDEGVAPWQVRKLYRRVRGVSDGGVIKVETGQFDPVLGRSWYQVAMASRSQHRSQDMGSGQELGPRASSITLWRTVDQIGPDEKELFAGVDTTLNGIVGHLDEVQARGVTGPLTRYRAALEEARAGLEWERPWGVAAGLRRGLAEIDAALAALDELGQQGYPVDDAMLDLHARREAAGRALLDAAGVVVRTASDDDLVVPGDTLGVTVEVWNGGPLPVSVDEIALQTDGWQIDAPTTGEDLLVGPGEVLRRDVRVVVPADARLSRLYFREQVRDGEMYRWPDNAELRARPFDPAVVRARLRLSVTAGGEAIELPTLDHDVRFTGVAKATGEFTRPLLVVPAVAVASRPSTMLWPVELDAAREVSVEVRAEDAHGARGSLRLEVPEGWQVQPARVPFDFSGPGESRAFTFRVTRTTAAPGRHEFVPVAELEDGRVFREGYNLIEYPHIDRVAFFEPAATRVSLASVRATAGLRVGYVMGSGDDGLDALRQIGVEVEPVDAVRLQQGELDDFDVLVLGIRVYETQPEVAAANEAILDFARSGGTVVVQYNKYEYPEGEFAPYRLSMRPRAPRVTDEGSPVRILDPASPLVTGPNALDLSDFEGWVQERGLYFIAEWDERYVPQLAFTDPGEDEALGSLLVAPVGQGLYLYTGISFFRQFPAGVPGAYRLFANLISLTRERWDSR